MRKNRKDSDESFNRLIAWHDSIREIRTDNRFYKVVDGVPKFDVELLYKYATKYNIFEDEENIRFELFNAINVAKQFAERWTDASPKYPGSPHNVGFILDGRRFVTEYTGIGGYYWQTDQYNRPLCRPW